MAKGKQGKAATRIAGVKVPKSLRSAGKSAKKLAQEPIVGELVAAALTAAAAQLASSKGTRRAAGDAASATMKDATAIGASVKRVLIDAARSLLDSYDGGASGGERKLSASAPAKRAKPARKKSAARS